MLLCRRGMQGMRALSTRWVVRCEWGCRRFTICCLALTTFALAACSQCHVGASRCDGREVERGEWDGEGPFAGRRWAAETCTTACVELSTGAACVDSAQPIAEC